MSSDNGGPLGGGANNYMITVGMANTREKMNVIRHLRIDLWWFTPELRESAETT